MKGNETTLLSVGIDIGTTTTHMVVCRLKADNTSAATRVPRLEIGSREIIYQSPIHFTSIVSDRIDAESVRGLIKEEYERAGIKPGDIQCGAIIITGESARYRNADQVVKSLSAFAGDFVAASAGPHLESILAAKGSGAKERSKLSGNIVCNVDIGGGTTNIAVFESGNFIESWCIALGGRFIRFDSSFRVSALSVSGRLLMERFKAETTLGSTANADILNSIAEDSAKLLLDAITNKVNFGELASLMLTEKPEFDYKVDEYLFSGGVAALMKNPPEDINQFGDLGAYLAKALVKEVASRKISVAIAESAIRATVIGAGSHTLQLSGHTVFADPSLLPLKNVPLIKFQSKEMESYLIALERSLKEENIDHKETPLALVFPDVPLATYKAISDCAELLSSRLDRLNLKEPIVLVLKSDAAMALGQLLKKQNKKRKYFVLDGIDTENGDFLEIGKPIENGLTLPVTIKTLVFPEFN